jgi:hypothetical protein
MASRIRPTVVHVADPIFETPRLAEVDDPLDPDRSDLDAYPVLPRHRDPPRPARGHRRPRLDALDLGVEVLPFR